MKFAFKIKAILRSTFINSKYSPLFTMENPRQKKKKEKGKSDTESMKKRGKKKKRRKNF